VEALTCRLLPFTVADGPTNMATDEVLLQSATSGVATLRFYGWQPATLSLGYFQPAQVRLADPLLAKLPWVRRPSGGDTLVHDREVTYALALPAGPRWQGRESWTMRMHRMIAAVLRTHAVVADLYPPVRPSPFTGPLCFHHCTPGDVLVAGHKIVGSAQRKQRGALLQHGGILCRTSPHTPALPGITELSGVEFRPTQIQAGVTEQCQRDTGWHLLEGALTSTEAVAVAGLVRDKYASGRWNQKR
jgi:lipoate-protein ligase A